MEFGVYKINNIGNDSKQEITFILNNGDEIVFDLFFSDVNSCWYIKKLTYKNYTLYNIKIIKTTNLLPQYNNLFPFLIMVNETPFFQNDFITDRCFIGIIQ